MTTVLSFQGNFITKSSGGGGHGLSGSQRVGVDEMSSREELVGRHWRPYFLGNSFRFG